MKECLGKRGLDVKQARGTGWGWKAVRKERNECEDIIREEVREHLEG